MATPEHLTALAQAFNDLGEEYWAELEDTVPRNKETYLIRFGKASTGLHTNLVLMGDLGITWEPWKAYPTDEMARIDGEDLSVDLGIMKAQADDWYGKKEE